MLCQVFPENYDSQLAKKVARVTELIPTFADQLEVFSSPVKHYRQRIEFRIWHTEEKMFYAMFEPGSKHHPVEIETCEVAAKPISDLMQPLLDALSADEVLSKSLFEVHFLSTLSGEENRPQMLVTLIYRKQLDNQIWLQAAEKLKQSLPIDHLIGRSRKQKIQLGDDFLIEKLQADNQAWLYQQIEYSFTQPNAEIAQKMLGWAREQSKKINPEKAHDLLELYCGNGNFSIALSDLYRQVFASEIARSSVNSAQLNLAMNQVKNTKIIKMAADEVARAMQGEEFNRLIEAQIKIEDYDFQTIFVDPPRAGLDDLTRGICAEFRNILYVSCNPETLARDLEFLRKTHKIQATALFDQFPYTDHIETGVWLTLQS